MKEKTWKVTLLVLFILIVFVVVLELTSAYMKPTVETPSVSEVSLNSCAKLSLIDSGISINMPNTAPMSDNKGLNTTPYEFTIKSSCDVSLRYKMYLGILSTNTLDANNIKYAIKEKETNSIIAEGKLTTEGTSDFTADEITQAGLGSGGTVNTIYTILDSTIRKQKETTYQLYLWVDEGADNENMQKVFAVSVMAKGFEEVELPDTLADHIKGLYTTQGANGLYLHDSTLENGAGDGSYRYAGADPNNYVCFGSSETSCPENNLYRIIGVFGDQVKLIKADYATKEILGEDGDYQGNLEPESTYKGSQTTISFFGWNYKNDSSMTDGSDDWNTSLLNKVNLNTNFLNKLGDTWANKIVETTWKVGGISISTSGTPKVFYEQELAVSKIYQAKIGLIYASEFGFAASSENWTNDLYNSEITINNNWLYLGENEWTMSPYSDMSNCIFRFNNLGILNVQYAVNGFGVRPTFSLNSSVSITGGEGTKNLPYRIS